MQNEALIQLIEEMIELKIRQHAAVSAAATRSDPHLARIISQTHAADHRRLEQIKGEIARVLKANDSPPPAPTITEPPRLRMSGG
ncbi:MAG: hypothetical protein JWR69_667 [Pedosphaera sp.]|nr:hypothetical protein [Pedosphaera sp.]